MIAELRCRQVIRSQPISMRRGSVRICLTNTLVGGADGEEWELPTLITESDDIDLSQEIEFS